MVRWHIVVSGTNGKVGACNAPCVNWWRLVTQQAFDVVVDTVSVAVDVLFGASGLSWP